nr:PREDICTED: beta-microseminoprotein-like [Lepisosteus oculatus]
MKHLLCFVAGLLATVAMARGDCYMELPKLGCQGMDGDFHEFGSKWIRNCYDCECSTHGISCCNKIPTAIQFPPQCEMIVNKKDCTWKLVLKNDHSKECS